MLSQKHVFNRKQQAHLISFKWVFIIIIIKDDRNCSCIMSFLKILPWYRIVINIIIIIILVLLVLLLVLFFLIFNIIINIIINDMNIIISIIIFTSIILISGMIIIIVPL